MYSSNWDIRSFRVYQADASISIHAFDQQDVATVGGVGGATSTDGSRVGCVCRIAAGLNPPTQ